MHNAIAAQRYPSAYHIHTRCDLAAKIRYYDTRQVEAFGSAVRFWPLGSRLEFVLPCAHVDGRGGDFQHFSSYCQSTSLNERMLEHFVHVLLNDDANQVCENDRGIVVMIFTYHLTELHLLLSIASDSQTLIHPRGSRRLSVGTISTHQNRFCVRLS